MKYPEPRLVHVGARALTVEEAGATAHCLHRQIDT
jgi:hypothetical protein